MEVSNSRIKLWRRCHRAHWYKYEEKLVKKLPPVPLIRGRIIHEMIEAWISGKSWKTVLDGYLKEYNKMFQEEKEQYGDLPSELPRIMEGYIRKWKKEPLEYLEVEGKRCEIPLKIDLLPQITFTAVIDAIAIDSRGRTWLVEHKTHKEIPPEEVRLSNLQTTLYCWALEQKGITKPTGVLWDYIRTKPPVIPEILKNGELSRRKNMDTDYDTYFQAIISAGQDPSDYQDILDILKSRGDRFYKRVYFPAPGSLIKPLVSEFIETAKEIFYLGSRSKARNLSRDCSWCSYYPLCQAELRGLDADYIRTTEYERRESEDEEVDET